MATRTLSQSELEYTFNSILLFRAVIPGARWDTYYVGVTKNGPLTTGEGEQEPFNRNSSSSSLALSSRPRLASSPIPFPSVST